MNRYLWLHDYLMNKPGTEEDFKEEWSWLRYRVRGKMFAAICTPDPKYQPHNGREMIILKCDPMLAELYREKYADVAPGFYSDKTHWNSIYLDGSLPEEELRAMCDQSYQLIFDKLSKKLQKEIMEEHSLKK
ncbi:MAG: MmcQ/YjbR family DNA-binding protein [Clostridiales bacterium]|jgi:predicted DNA-binding protein (MmcQ/YjbR family)|nr:MmcQ/YjbR family DNA-binding protein [Clostridiales bacterium]